MSTNMRPQEGQATATQRQKINAPSSLLTSDENETVFKMLGRKCQALNTAVVQIYKTEGSAHSHWKKKYTGVVCFVKDSIIRSYFLRAYCLIKNELVWEHEVYEGMKIIKARQFLLTFEGQDGHVGLNFVSEEECDSFYRAVNLVIEARSRKKLDKRNRPKSQMAPNAPPVAITREPPKVPSSASQSTTDSVTMRNNSKIGSITFTQGSAVAPAASKNFLSLSGGGGGGAAKDKKRKVTKADISQPTNFVHISHVGWDEQKGFDLTGHENDDVLNNFFLKAGVSEIQLQDRDTRAFIYDFIQANNVLDSVKSESRVDKPKAAAPAPPPVPSRHQHPHNGNAASATHTTPTTTATATASATTTTSQRTAPPPPPPARQPPPPIPTTVPGAIRAPPPPSRPPPVNNISTSAAAFVNAPAVAPPPPPPAPPVVQPPPPPPPPPPMMEPPIITKTLAPTEHKAPSSLPVVTDSHNALMDSIRKGTTLKKVDTAALSTGSGDSHSDLMSEIRMGLQLKPAQTRELPANRSSDDGTGTDALADALRRALQERGRVMQSSDEESESSANDDEWED